MPKKTPRQPTQVDPPVSPTLHVALTNLERFPTLASHYVNDEFSPALLRLPPIQARAELKRLEQSTAREDRQVLVDAAAVLRAFLQRLKPLMEERRKRLEELENLLIRPMEALGHWLLDRITTYVSTRNPAIREQIRKEFRQLLPDARGDKFFSLDDLVSYYDEMLMCLHEIRQRYRQADRKIRPKVRTELYREYPFFTKDEWKEFVETNLVDASSEPPSVIAGEILAKRYRVLLKKIKQSLKEIKQTIRTHR